MEQRIIPDGIPSGLPAASRKTVLSIGRSRRFCYATKITDILGISYPDLIEKYGHYWISETQKTEARVHGIDSKLLEGLWRQGIDKTVAREGLMLEWSAGKNGGKAVVVPRVVDLSETGGLSLDCWITLDDMKPGQTILDTRGSTGVGIALTTTEQGTVRLSMNDGKNSIAWDCGRDLLTSGKPHHLVAIADAGPKLITFIVDGQLCDGGRYHWKGWQWWKGDLGLVLNRGPLHVGPALKSLRVYDRCLHTSEAIANYNAGME